jgi:hypothetical protein
MLPHLLFSTGAFNGVLWAGERILLNYEASVSTVKNAPQAAAWVFESKLEQEWEGDFAQSPPGGAQAADPGIKPWPPDRPAGA